MNTLLVTVLASLALASASVGPHGGAVVSGPSGIVTNHGAIGPNGLPNGVIPVSYGQGLSYGHGPLVAPSVLGHGLGLGLGPLGLGHGIGSYGLGHGIGLGAIGFGHGIAPLGIAVGHGSVVTNGGGVIRISPHGVSVRGPPTAPAVISGPAGKVVADGLWGPTPLIAGHGYH